MKYVVYCIAGEFGRGKVWLIYFHKVLAKESLVNGQTKQNNDCEACVTVCRLVLCATVKLEIFNALLCLRMLMTAN